MDTKSFVDAKGGWIETKAWFVDNLGWTEQQIIAIMGAHTLGMIPDKHFSDDIDYLDVYIYHD